MRDSHLTFVLLFILVIKIMLNIRWFDCYTQISVFISLQEREEFQLLYLD